MLNKRQRSQLRKIVDQVDKIIAQADAAETRQRKASSLDSSKKGTRRRAIQRVRRNKEDANRMKREIKAARKKGQKVTDLAIKYGVSPAYIYMMK